MAMTSSYGSTATSRIQLALQSPLQYRCEEITRIIDELGTKELQNALPLLLIDLFGVTGNGWGLRTVMHSNEFTDYNILYQFLHPQGPVFRLLYKLLQDCHLKYEFPLQWLPVQIRQMILKGMVPPFYADKLQLDPQTRTPIGLSLNSFELFIFHFAYHLVNPDLQRVQMNAWLYSDSLYLNLTEAYLSELLPCDRSNVHPPVPLNFGVLQSYSTSFSPYNSISRGTARHSTSRQAHTPHLLRQSILQQSNSPGSIHTSPVAAVPSTRTEIWRSETVAQVFVDFWLSHGESEIGSALLGSGSPQRYRTPVNGMDELKQFPVDYGMSLQYNPMEQAQVFKLPLKYPELLPSGEHIRVVRNLIKHMHYFSNSVSGDHSAMDELRRIIVPSSQAKIYGFLRRTIHHWPLDSSFRFILETWLSYIQPWRYTDHRFRISYPSGRGENDEVDSRSGRSTGIERRGVDRQWLSFVAENLLSYTVIFQEMLPRFARLDLSTPKNANMLFRVSKVFSQPHLAELLREVESCLDDSIAALSPQKRPASLNSSEDQRAGYAAHQATKWSAVVRQQIQDLESPGFHYKPMFGSESRVEVIHLMRIVQQAQSAAVATQRALEHEATARSRSRTFLSSLKEMLMLSDVYEVDEYSPEERLRVSTFLHTALTQFSEIFLVNLTELQSEANVTMNGTGMDVTDSFATPSFSRSLSYRGHQPQLNLTPVATEALSSTPDQWRQRSLKIRFDGDPDLLPVRSDENAFLVRLMHQVASRLNEMYCGDLSRLYYRNDVWGRVARQVLSPPTSVWKYDKSPGNFSPRREAALPPRLSLRALARHRNLLFVSILYLISWLCMVSPPLVITSAILLWAALVFLKAFVEPWTSSSQRTVNDTLFNDSVGS